MTAATFASAKDRRLRQWAARIVSDLPPDPADAKQVLSLAEQLRRQWLVDQRAPKGGAAR